MVDTVSDTTSCRMADSECCKGNREYTSSVNERE